ncbi:hypothetical protein PR048_031525 [Dryococelus australis]|uniref:Uncharacterized protein n=1 Tax=Dryococelus australis TaxID=614101 RepID=A0ABQ9G6K7_9NEOP|nr:hypothetical protein PR048_031525 [Dryococelus australis]
MKGQRSGPPSKKTRSYGLDRSRPHQGGACGFNSSKMLLSGEVVPRYTLRLEVAYLLWTAFNCSQFFRCTLVNTPFRAMAIFPHSLLFPDERKELNDNFYTGHVSVKQRFNSAIALHFPLLQLRDLALSDFGGALDEEAQYCSTAPSASDNIRLLLEATNARLHHRGSKLEPRSDLRLTLKTVAPFEFRAGLEFEMKFISNRRSWLFEISIRDQQPSPTHISSAYWSLGCVLIGCCPAPGSCGIRKVFPCKSAVGPEACKAGPIICDPIAKVTSLYTAGHPRENPPTNGTVRHDSHMRRSGDPAGDGTSWEASRLTAQPPWGPSLLRQAFSPTAPSRRELQYVRRLFLGVSGRPAVAVVGWCATGLDCGRFWVRIPTKAWVLFNSGPSGEMHGEMKEAMREARGDNACVFTREVIVATRVAPPGVWWGLRGDWYLGGERNTTSTECLTGHLRDKNERERETDLRAAAVNLLVSYQGEAGSIPGRVTPGCRWSSGFLSGISRYLCPFIPALIHCYLISPASALKTSFVKSRPNLSNLTSYKGGEKCEGGEVDGTSRVGGFLSHFPSFFFSLWRQRRCKWRAGATMPLCDCFERQVLIRAGVIPSQGRKCSFALELPFQNEQSAAGSRQSYIGELDLGLPTARLQVASSQSELVVLATAHFIVNSLQITLPPVKRISAADATGRVYSVPRCSLVSDRNALSLLAPAACTENRLECSPPTKANRVQSPAGSLPDFRKVGIVLDDSAGLGGFFSGIPPSTLVTAIWRRSILAFISPSSALKTSSRAA